MTSRDFINHVQQDNLLRDRLVEAIKAEWGNKGVSSSEPYLTNGAWRAVYAVLRELDAMAPLDQQRTSSSDQEPHDG
jgi:hypothetical protein